MAEIVLRGRRYPALFDLQNVKELQEHFGDLKVVAEKLNDPEEAAYIIWLGLLGYTRRETRFLSLDELLAQFTEYCAMNGIELPQERGLADGDA